MAIQTEAVLQWSVTLKDQALTALSNLSAAVDRINESASKFGSFLTGTGSLRSFFMESLSGSNTLLNLAKSTGLSTDQLQKWSYAAKSAGVSAESILNNMKSLKGQWGIGERDLLRYASSFQKMGTWGRYQMGSLLGMTDDMITLLSQGPKAVQKWLDEAEKMGAVIPREEIEKAAEAHRKWETTLESFHKTSEKTLTPFIEKFTELLEKVNKFVSSNPEKTFTIIKTALTQILALNVASWATRTMSNLKQIWKVLSFSTAEIKEIGNQAENVDKVTRSFNGLKASVSGIFSIFKGALIGEAMAQWIDALTDSKYSDKLGEFWGNVFFKAGKWYDKIAGNVNEVRPLPTSKELVDKYVPELNQMKIGPTTTEKANNFGNTLIMPDFSKERESSSNVGNDIVNALEKMTLNQAPETSSMTTSGGNTFYIYNFGGSGVGQELQNYFNR